MTMCLALGRGRQLDFRSMRAICSVYEKTFNVCDLCGVWALDRAFFTLDNRSVWELLFPGAIKLCM